jgi:hypothetical protein
MKSNDVALSNSVPTPELIRQAVDGARELVRLELRLAREELRNDVARFTRIAVWSGVLYSLANVCLATLVFGSVLLSGGGAGVAFAVAGILALLVAVLAFVVYRILPGVPLKRTRARLQSEMTEFKEHVV